MLTVVVTLLLSYLVLPVLPAAAAAGITLAKSAPSTVRAGAPITYRLTAAQPGRATPTPSTSGTSPSATCCPRA